ncbi:hypothetical protein PF001_g33612, partial [Phytophthora fragariae]
MSLAVTSFVAATSATSLAAFFFLPADSFASADSWTTVSAFASAVSVTGTHPLDSAISISAVVRLAACLFPPCPHHKDPSAARVGHGEHGAHSAVLLCTDAAPPPLAGVAGT